uniref:NADH-ubiquinone oxidoreductase chain 4L n=1 Tax=Parhyale hawaiensis TaxID=317513 RepID=Q6DVI4_9CRUS|nr:NADH dehydrogenase subunit 4L [Parhyale hawaiensis]AAT69315.1 NADH dehydrogenase subunit 4L [Parhyale hawaiensis]AYB71610.1 NADH dehydrogenase subunit 4L [Parhyale hawaiensis]
MFMYMVFYLMVFSAVFSFVMNYNHLLNSLLSLEMISLSLYFLMGLGYMVLGMEIYNLLYFLVMLVCEGVLGLSILIMIVYGYGEDYMKSFSVLMC